MEGPSGQTTRKVPIQTPAKLLERIPIAGLENYLHSTGKTEKRLWAFLLLICLAVTLRYLVPCVLTYLEVQTAVEVTQLTTPSMPLPAIYVRAASALNGTYLLSVFFAMIPALINDTRTLRLTQTLGQTYPDMDIGLTLYQAMLYATHVPIYPPWYKSAHVPIYNEIIYKVITTYGSQWIGLSGVYSASIYRCDELLSGCTLNGIPFPCCEHSQAFSTAGHPTHRLNMSAILLEAAKQMPTTPTGRFSLKFQTKIDRMQVIDGLQKTMGTAIAVGGAVPSIFDSSYALPGGAKVFIKVTGRRRQLMKDCTHKFHYVSPYGEKYPDLKRYWESMEEPENYSVQKCWTAKIIESVVNICGCVPYYDTMQPNETYICTPAHIHACYTTGFYGDIELTVGTNDVQHGSAKIEGSAEPTIPGSSPKPSNAERKQNVLLQLKNAELVHASCLPLCDTWYYDATFTMVSLNEQLEEFTTIEYNEIVLTIDPEYRVESDVLKMDLIGFFAAFGDGLGLFLGLSAGAFVQAAVWSIAAGVLVYDRRRIRPGDRLTWTGALDDLKTDNN